VVSEIESVLDSEPDISRPLSIRHALSLAPGVDGPAKLGLASLLPADLSRQFWRPDINQAQVIARIQDLGMAHYRPILDRVEREFAKLTIAHPGVQIELTGEAIIESQAVQQVVKELFYSLALAAVIIFVVITIAVRSIRFGLLTVIPNIFPLVATGAMRACIDTSLDIASACSFAICLGIAVDDTIHFLMRFRHATRTRPRRRVFHPPNLRHGWQCLGHDDRRHGRRRRLRHDQRVANPFSVCLNGLRHDRFGTLR
jgi:predicted RND superfamily exporter protein